MWVRYLILALSTSSIQIQINNLTYSQISIYCILFFIILVILKVLIGVCLVFYSRSYQEKQYQSLNPDINDITKINSKYNKNEINNNKNNENDEKNSFDLSDKSSNYNNSNNTIVNESTIEIRRKAMNELLSIERYTVYKGRVIG